MTKLNLGCGPHPLPGWINYDFDETCPALPRGVVSLDLSQGRLPHADNSVDFIFSEHFIEHISKKEGLTLLRECRRVLTPEGVLRLSTPDLARLAGTYSDGVVATIPGTWEPQSVCDMMNEGMRLWGHQYLYDKAEIATVLKDAGFNSAWDCKRGVSMHEELKSLELRPEYFEMYIEARKQPLLVP